MNDYLESKRWLVMNNEIKGQTCTLSFLNFLSFLRVGFFAHFKRCCPTPNPMPLAWSYTFVISKTKKITKIWDKKDPSHISFRNTNTICPPCHNGGRTNYSTFLVFSAFKGWIRTKYWNWLDKDGYKIFSYWLFTDVFLHPCFFWRLHGMWKWKRI